ncbi:hypothetical protein H6G33_09515 [Calothrix sp. FACHB-1219]|uniref:hypothetical protein n=1 Tax=unclassified Calothrix TaxID=2619626 RepID=UPI0016834F7B|nr:MULTISPECIES: hypothetical protein [unclassified Calothrix]MBD2201584.1 hypothetical protein [Calothrix sp. FACHB-168]MBD2217270.1 hypothetical protein [Calothrix sp. FACHB-1219]
MELLKRYQNGNVLVSLYKDGTRHLEYEGTLELEYPLNIDITVSSRCSNGIDPRTGKAICSYCHVSARRDGVEGDYKVLKKRLLPLPRGIELAIAVNEFTKRLMEFLEWANEIGFVVNLTVNQIHLPKYKGYINWLINQDIVKGLGISYRKGYESNNVLFLLEYENTVLHCIAGLDNINTILESPYNKVLILGYKNLGLGKEFYDLDPLSIERNIREWQMWLPKLFGKKIVSFDNLAIEQLNVKRFFSKRSWEVFYQMEESIYIDTVEGIYSPSSRDVDKKVSWNDLEIKDYFRSLK